MHDVDVLDEVLADVLPLRHKIDIDEYDRMAEAGVFRAETRIELIDGELLDMAPIGAGHEATVNRLNKSFVIACGDQAIVSIQNSVRIDWRNVPEPDVALFRYRKDFYSTGTRPGPADVILLIEVSETSLYFDRTVKLPLYARAGIAEVWIVDLKGAAVNVYRTPQGDGYAEMTTHRAGEQVGVMLLPDVVVTLGPIVA